MISPGVDNKYFERYQRNRDGFVIQSGQNDSRIQEPEKNGQPPFWELRISINPDLKNLTKAAEVLSPILTSAGVTFKIIKFTSLETPSWDGTKENIDRDQRGKEVCIFMPLTKNKNHDSLYTPSFLKKLMLDCWVALEKNNVKIGYYSASTDQAIHLDSGENTPFSYAAFKPFKQRRGILHEKNYNPLGWTDPLKDVHLSCDDLKNHGLNPSAVCASINKNKKEYVENHFPKAKSDIVGILWELKEKESTVSVSDLEQDYDDLQENFNDEEKRNEIVAKINRQPEKLEDGKSCPLIDEGWIEYLAKQDEKERNKCIQEKKTNDIEYCTQEYKNIQAEYADSVLHEQYSEFSKEDFINIAKNHPREMQSLYPRMVHLHRENESYLRVRSPSNVQVISPPNDKDEPPELPGYNKAVIMALAGLGLMFNCASGIDILADFNTDIKHHVGGKWVLSAFSVLGALSLFAGSINLQKKNQIQPRSSLVVGAKFADFLGLVCIAQAIVHALSMDREFAIGLLDCAISFVSGAIVLGLAYNNASNVAEERSAARIKI